MRPYCSECGGDPRWLVHTPNTERDGDRWACDWHLLRAIETLILQTGEVTVTRERA